VTSLSVVFILFVDPSPIVFGEGFFYIAKLLSVISKMNCFYWAESDYLLLANFEE